MERQDDAASKDGIRDEAPVHRDGSNPIATARAATTMATPSDGDSARRSGSSHCPRCWLARAIQHSRTWRSANRMATRTMNTIGPGSHFPLADRNASKCDQENNLKGGSEPKVARRILDRERG